jgi:prepilin-type processing-associated H-X9-DG protein
MNKSEISNRPKAGKSAFTRADLLALLSVLALLAVMALPSLGRVSGKTTIAQCAANLQQYDLALQIYGNENQDNLPTNSGGNWVWDASLSLTSFLTNTGVKWTELYCPGTSPRFTEQDNRSLFNFGGVHILGYAGTVPGAAALSATNINATLTLQRVPYFAVFFPVKPASRVLVADATLNDTGTSSVYAVMLTYNWVNIDGGFAKLHLSPHLKGTVPLGGNVGMLDGHVEWRNFKNMLARTSSSPYFYW